MIYVDTHEITKRERQIERLEAELDRRANIITALSNALCEANISLMDAGRLPFYARF